MIGHRFVFASAFIYVFFRSSPSNDGLDLKKGRTIQDPIINFDNLALIQKTEQFYRMHMPAKQLAGKYHTKCMMLLIFMRKFLLYSCLFICTWLFLANCFIMRNRWPDGKATRVFAARQVPLRMYDTVISNRHLHYAISGNDSLPALVFIHGSPGSWMNYIKFMWDEEIRKKFRVVAIDRPGFGYSDFGKAMHLEDQCKIILPLLRSLKSGKAMFLCGHSLGGPVSIQLAAMDTSLFETIVLVAGSIDVNQEKKENWRRVMSVPVLRWFLPGAFAPSNKEILFLKKDLIALQKQFAKVHSNVKFIHGDADTWVPIQNIAYGKKALVNARSITADTLSGADHQIPWKNREELKQILMRLY